MPVFLTLVVMIQCLTCDFWSWISHWGLLMNCYVGTNLSPVTICLLCRAAGHCAMDPLILKLDLYSNAKHFFIALLHAHFCFYGMNIHPLDQYQNAIPRTMTLHDLKKVQSQEHVTFMTQDSVGHLKTLWMSILLLSGSVESELLAQRWKKCLAFEYESSFSLCFSEENHFTQQNCSSMRYAWHG